MGLKSSIAAGLVGLAIAAAAGGAQARPVGVWGPGAESCAHWAEARGGTTLWRDYFEGWALGFLSDANVRRYSVRDPNPALGDLLHGRQPENYFQSIDAACAAEPSAMLVSAATTVVNQLITTEQMNAAVVGP